MMAGFIAQQPNGLYCRFSTVVDTITHYNMTFDDYVNVIIKRGKTRDAAIEEATDVIENYIQPFEMVLEEFHPRIHSIFEFEELLHEMGCDFDYSKYKTKWIYWLDDEKAYYEDGDEE